MNKTLKAFIQISLLILPWPLRRYFLGKIFGFTIHKSAKIGISIILAKKLLMEAHTYIGTFNICNAIDTLSMSANSIIGSFVYITGYPTNLQQHFTHIVNRRCELIIGSHSAITSRHFIDCTAGVYIGSFTTVAGIRSQLMTHSIDLRLNKQHAKEISIGDYCFIGTECVILGGAELPNYSILGAKSLLSKKVTEIYSLYGGVPAKFINKLDKKEFEYFSRTTGFVN